MDPEEETAPSQVSEELLECSPSEDDESLSDSASDDQEDLVGSSTTQKCKRRSKIPPKKTQFQKVVHCVRIRQVKRDMEEVPKSHFRQTEETEV